VTLLKISVTPLTLAKIEGILGSFFMLVVMIIGLSASLAVPIPPITLVILVIVMVFNVAGNYLIFNAVEQISYEVNDREIFHNVFVWFILHIAGIAIFLVVMYFLRLILEKISVRSLIDIFTGLGMIEFSVIHADLWRVVAGSMVMWFVLIAAARFLRKSYERIAARTGTEIFRAVEYWYYWGTRLAIVFVGFIFIVIALILQIMAFYFLPSSIQSRRTAAFAVGPEF
jgi:uncharacterized membrane protein